MKKIVCVILMISLLATVIGVKAGAITNEEDLTSAFFDYCGGNDIDWSNPNILPSEKKVNIYECKETENAVFFSGIPGWIAPGDMGCVEKFDKWCVYSNVYNSPYSLALYVKVESIIYTLEEAWEKGLVSDLTCIEGFSKYTKVYCVGDVDLDFDVSILDATLIQQEVAQLAEFNELQATSADVDGDGDTSVLDATSIQLELAKV